MFRRPTLVQNSKLLEPQSHQLVECKSNQTSEKTYLYSSNDSNFVTGSRNGTVTLWKNKIIEKSVKHFDEWTLVLFKNDRIFAASANKDVIELNLSLDVVKRFNGRDCQPFTIDANEEYLIVGYKSGNVDVHKRNEFDRNGTHQKMVIH